MIADTRNLADGDYFSCFGRITHDSCSIRLKMGLKPTTRRNHNRVWGRCK